MKKRLPDFFELLRHPRFRRLYLRNALLVFFSFVTILALAQCSMYIYSRTIMVAELDSNSRRNLAGNQAQLDTLFGDVQDTLLRLSNLEDLNMLLRSDRDLYPNFFTLGRMNAVLDAIQKAQRDAYFSVILCSAHDGYVYSSLTGSQTASQFSDQNLLACLAQLPASARETYLLRQFEGRRTVLIDAPSGMTVLTLIRPIQVIGRDRPSFLAVNLRISYLSEMIASTHDHYEGDMLVANGEGLVIFDGRMRYAGTELVSLFGQEDARELAGASAGARTLAMSGELFRLRWNTSQTTGLTYLWMIPYEAYAFNLNSLLSFFFVAFVLGVFFALILSVWLSMRIFRPIGAILKLVEDPYGGESFDDYDQETRYILMSILLTYQRNSTLSEDMAKRYAALRAARTRMLQGQITPHFLHNSLQTIHWLALMETGDEQSRTSAAILTLAELMSAYMDRTANTMPLGEEMTQLKRYLTIQQLRFGESLQVCLDVPEELLGVEVPRICLQPLVENSISHGGRDLMRVSVRAEACEPNRIRIVVEDNGKGIPEEEMAHYASLIDQEFAFTGNHIGLVNLIQRLRLIYEGDAQIALSRSEMGGLKVEFTVPK